LSPLLVLKWPESLGLHTYRKSNIKVSGRKLDLPVERWQAGPLAADG